jgi:hypothetical protein
MDSLCCAGRFDLHLKLCDAAVRSFVDRDAEASENQASMKTVAEYRKHAKECRTLAQRAKSPEERAMILRMAETWEDLARSRERKLTKERPLPTLE